MNGIANMSTDERIYLTRGREREMREGGESDGREGRGESEGEANRSKKRGVF